MASKIKHLPVDEAQVNLIQQRGLLNGDKILGYYRHMVTHAPRLVTYATLIDIRTWAGVVTDAEVRDYVLWIQDFRKAHGLPEGTLAKVVYLGLPASGGDTIAARTADLRGTSSLTFYTVEAAWNHLAPHIPLPPAAKRFLG